MVIVDTDVDEPVAQSWVKTATEAISAAGGSVHGKPDWWGKRPFAYPINKKETGYYFVIECVAPAVPSMNSSVRSVSPTTSSATN